jgi:hypothetical protein
MKNLLFTAALVLGAVWLWSKLAKPAAAKTTKSSNTVPVDTGTFFGPYIDPITGAYLAPGNTTGAVAFQTQPVGVS